MKKFDYYGSYFESMSGIHFQLPHYLQIGKCEMKRCTRFNHSVKRYISICRECIGVYKKQEENGLLMLDLESIIEYCDSILHPGENSAILASMNTCIEQLSLDAEKPKNTKVN